MEYTTTESREPRGVEEAGCKIYSGGPTVSQTMGEIRRKEDSFEKKSLKNFRSL